MFQPVSQNLYEISMFAILGFFLGALYEPLRLLRLFVKTGAVWVGIQDFLFLSASGVIVFAYSLEFGAGHFRYFYIIAIAFGGTVYFLTAGKLISFIAKMFAEPIKRAVKLIARWFKRKIFMPITQKLALVFKKIRQYAEKRHKVLKNALQVRYNNRKAKRSNARRERRAAVQESENAVKRNAVKARIVSTVKKA